MHATLVVLHVLGATIWTGGHLILALGFLPPALRAGDPQTVFAFESRFERIGLPALAVQVLTGIALTLLLLTDETVELGGHILGSLGLKVVLLLATAALAVHARLRLIPRLQAETDPAATARGLRRLATHIVAVTVIAVLFTVLGVGVQLAPR